jgi:subtilisin family serine protease
MNKLIIIFLSLLTIAFATNEKLKVMVIDTGRPTNPKVTKYIPKEYKNEPVDTHGHSTAVSCIIVGGICPNVELIPCKYYYEDKDIFEERLMKEIACIDKATKLKVNIINLSGGGVGSLGFEKEAIERFTKAGGLFVTASGNDGYNLDYYCNYYPCCYKLPNEVCVGSTAPTANHGKFVEIEAGEANNCNSKAWFGSKIYGTSISTAIRTNKLILEWCKQH